LNFVLWLMEHHDCDFQHSKPDHGGYDTRVMADTVATVRDELKRLSEQLSSVRESRAPATVPLTPGDGQVM
jgi:hypothetical protein